MTEIWVGTERQIAWAQEIKRKASPVIERWIKILYDSSAKALVYTQRGGISPRSEAAKREVRILRDGLTITDARFWIDNREVPDMQAFLKAVETYQAPKTNPPAGSYPVMSYAAAHAWERQAAARGVSEVARSARGFMRAYQRAGSWAKLSPWWKHRREGFLARHIAQAMRGENIWERTRQGVQRPTRRSLAMIMWAFMPPKKPAGCRPGVW